MFRVCPENIDNAVVFLTESITPACEPSCRLCVDFGVGIHNWLMANQVGYLILDFQDEKDVCPVFIEEMINLRKRLRIPFYFVGVMQKPRKMFEEYGIYNSFHISPESAVEDLRQKSPELLSSVDLKTVNFFDKVTVSKARLQQRLGVDLEQIHQPGEVSL